MAPMKLSVITPLAAIACITLSACASTGGIVADTVPTWLGGMPNDVPPRRGKPDYDAGETGRAKESSRPKTKQKEAHAPARERKPPPLPPMRNHPSLLCFHPPFRPLFV